MQGHFTNIYSSDSQPRLPEPHAVLIWSDSVAKKSEPAAHEDTNLRPVSRDALLTVPVKL